MADRCQGLCQMQCVVGKSLCAASVLCSQDLMSFDSQDMAGPFILLYSPTSLATICQSARTENSVTLLTTASTGNCSALLLKAPKPVCIWLLFQVSGWEAILDLCANHVFVGYSNLLEYLHDRFMTSCFPNNRCSKEPSHHQPSSFLTHHWPFFTHFNHLVQMFYFGLRLGSKLMNIEPPLIINHRIQYGILNELSVRHYH